MKLKFILTLLPSVVLLLACSEDSGTTAPSVVSSSSETPIVVSSSSESVPVEPIYYGTYPANANAIAVSSLYSAWITKFYVTFEEEVAEADYPYLGSTMVAKLQGSARIKWDTPTYTVSEGIGYGMILTCFAGDWDRFNRLLKYYKAYPVSEASGLYFMRWKVNGFAAAGTGESATDADLDVVTALLIAYEKTGLVDYLTEAKLVASSIYNTEVNKTTYLLMPANSGDYLSTGYSYNISYFSPVALRLLVAYDTERDWTTVLNKTYDYMIAVQAAGNGLWPDWSDASGAPIDPKNGSSTGSTYNNYYGLEGVRIPWRLVWDYHWFGDPRTKQMLDIAANFAYNATGGDILQTLTRYIYQGIQPTAGLGGIAFRGSFCALGMVSANYQTYLTNCNTVLLNTALPTNNYYFQATLQVVYLQLLNGYYVR